MRYRRLGSTGLKVSVIGLGTNQFGGKVDRSTAVDIIHAALDLGINFIDTADVYREGRSEEYIGEALQGKRDRAVIATKVRHKTGEGPNDAGASRQHILDGVEVSLRRLKTETIDLYQIHRWDEETPIEETMRALEDLVRSGKVRYIGASNFDAWQITHANAVARTNGWTQFASLQSHYHMFERGLEVEIIPMARYFDIGILPYFPLAGGFLTGKYRRGEGAPAGSRGESSPYVQRYMTPENYDKLALLKVWADEYGRSLTELAHAWLLAEPQVASVISGATKVEHVVSNARASDWLMDDEERDELKEILEQQQAE